MATIASGLKRDVLLKTAMEAFKKRLAPILAFATRFEDKPLEGTNKVVVPYLPLASGNATDWDANNGYVVAANGTLATKEVTVNLRKYRGVKFTSDEFNRQPYFDQEKFMMREGQALADGIVSTIWGAVTAANFPATTIAAQAATAFDLDDVLALRELATKLYWPSAGRGLILDTAPGMALMKDSRLGFANAQATDQVRNGFPTFPVGTFDVYEAPNLPVNGAEKLMGAAVFPSAILVATAPIRPTGELRKVIDYTIVKDPDTGLTFDYRAWGDPDFDVTKEVIECNFGFAVGEANALLRITTP